MFLAAVSRSGTLVGRRGAKALLDFLEGSQTGDFSPRLHNLTRESSGPTEVHADRYPPGPLPEVYLADLRHVETNHRQSGSS